ncbi:MAG TPA: ABC transporter ATP-binding protein [Actinocrinis sp.]
MTVAPILRIRGLSVSLGGSAVLREVSFDVAATGVTALLGRNGVGKTTTVRSVLGLHRPGSVARGSSLMFEDRELCGMRTDRIARLGIGYVPEDRAVFAGLTVAENLRLAEPPRGRGTLGAARYDFVHELFPVLRERARQPAGTLSGGEQQMLALARVLLGPSRLLVIDEPTKGLAPKVAGEVAAALLRAARQVPVLLVEQNLAVVRRMARDAVVLDVGRVVHTGGARDLLADADLTNRLLGVAAALEPAETAAAQTSVGTE